MLLRQRRERTMQNTKERQMEKGNSQAALQTHTRADKATQPNQDIRIINHDAESEDDSDEINFPIGPLNEPKHRVTTKPPLRCQTVCTKPLLGDPLPGNLATATTLGHKPNLGDRYF